jgi:predicted regulator of Ras-like GTPase activity (Roadblock/LC7/MglB family)
VSIQAALEKLVHNTPKSIGAILVDWEGEAVQEFCYCDPYEIRFIAAHKAIILAAFKDLHADGGQNGMLEEIVVTSSGVHLIIGSIDQDYSLVLSTDRACPLSLARHHFRDALIEIRKEI